MLSGRDSKQSWYVDFRPVLFRQLHGGDCSSKLDEGALFIRCRPYVQFSGRFHRTCAMEKMLADPDVFEPSQAYISLRHVLVISVPHTYVTRLDWLI